MHHARSHGFTLLEVLLALGLTALLLVALGMVIDFHFRVLDAGRTHVEEAQLARVLLRRIADDLRAAVCSSPENLQAATMAAAPEPAAAPAAEGEEPAAEATGESTLPEATEFGTAPSVPGIYGDSASIQVDVSRLPQPQEMQGMVSAASGGLGRSLLGDVKTITYFANGPQGSGTTLATIPPNLTRELGLVRCEQDRAVASFAAEFGGGIAEDLNAVLLAPEVAAVEFAYCDGYDWYDYWDTVENGGLPVAVRVTVYITPAKSKRIRSAQRGATGNASTPEDALVYSLLVSIPVAQASQAIDTSDTDDMSDESGEGGSESDGETDEGSGGPM